MTRIILVSQGGLEQSSSVADLLTPAAKEIARVDAIRWIKQLRLVRYDGMTMRERFTYRSDSLWWFTELYLHKMRRLDRAVDATLALDAAYEAHRPAKIVLDEADPTTAEVAKAFGRARNVPVEFRNSAPDTDRTEWSGYLVGLSATLSRLRPQRAVAVDQKPSVVAFLHTAFWRASSDGSQGQEGYIGPVLEAVARRLSAADLFHVGVGPRKNFRARRWWDPIAGGASSIPALPIERLSPRRALRGSLALWKRRRALAKDVTSGDDVRTAAMYRGCDLWNVLGPELEAAALVQWPWSARAMDEAGAALDALEPETMLTYAEAGGWGRALVLEARRRRVRSIGVQHGFMYRHWLNYLHEPDELAPIGDDRGFPAPDSTLVYDGYAAQFLKDASHFPASRIAVTGNARLEELAARVQTARGERDAVRRELGVGDGESLIVLVAKFNEVRDELPALFDAVGARPRIALVVKTHPAETPELYQPLAHAHRRIRTVPAAADLARLLAAADGIVTKNSTVAIDALSLGVPSLVIGLPNNLTPFVDAGVMLGASRDAEVGPALERLLYDLDARRRLAAEADRFVDRYGMRPSHGAAERAADEIVSTRTTA